jgi:hypothetical protein
MAVVDMMKGMRYVIAVVTALTILVANPALLRLNLVCSNSQSNGPHAQATAAVSPVALPSVVSGNRTVVNVKDFGAKGDGVADDTAAIQNAVNFAPAGSTLYVPRGTYMIKATGDNVSGNNGGVIVNKSLKFVMDKSTVLKAITGNKDQSAVLSFVSADKAEICGGSIIGDRDTNTNVKEWGHCLYVYECSNIYVHDIFLSKSKGDTLWIGSDRAGKSHDTLVENVIIDNPRRWGLAYASGGERLTVRNCTFQNVSTDLAFGGSVDLEDQCHLDEMNCVVFENCKFINTTSPNGDITVQGINTKNYKFINNIFTGTGSTPYGINYYTAQSIDQLLISGNYFYGYKRNQAVIVRSDKKKGVVIEANRFSDCTTGISFGGSAAENI